MTLGRHIESRGILSLLPRLSLRAKGVAALAVPMAALFAALFGIYWAEQAAHLADQATVRAHDTQIELLQLRIIMLDTGSAISDYLATGEPRFLPEYEQARTSTAAVLARINSLTSDDPAGVAILPAVRQAVADEMQILGDLRAGSPAPDLRTGLLNRTKRITDDIQARLAVLYQEQDLRLFRARYNRDLARHTLFRVVLVCGIIGPLGALFVHLIVFGRFVKRLQEVEENARRLAHGLPLEPFSSGSDEISELASQVEDTANLLGERERELRQSEQRYRDLFDQAPIPYEETDCEGVVRRFNQAVCDLLKCGPDRLLGRRAWSFVAPGQQEAVREAMLERIATGVEAGSPFECNYLLEDGSCITLEIRENLIRSHNGRVTGVCRSLVDVTERNLAVMAARKVEQYAMELRNKNEQLVHALAAARSSTEAKSRFLAAMSHELRTPLNGIIGFSEVMYDGRVGPLSDIHREYLGDILTSARHLLELINDVLDLSKVEAGRMEFHPEFYDIEALVHEVRDVVSPLAEKKSIHLTTEVPAELTAEVDTSRFKQVLYNFLSNAVKFTPEGGKVSVRVALDGNGSLRLDVEDTGIGIAPNDLPLLFQDFQQLPGSNRAGQGTGLGLALTRHIVEAQGGRVTVHSTPGGGSTFSAVLPISTTGNGTNNPESGL